MKPTYKWIRACLQPLLWMLLLGGLFGVQQLHAAPDKSVNTIKSGTLTIGSDLTYPPYYSTEEGRPVGFGPDLMRAVAQQMGLKPKFVNTRFAQLIVQLKAHHFDVVASALYITPERAKQIDYVPLFETGNSLLARSASDYQPGEIKDLCGHSVGAIRGASFIAKLKKSEKTACPPDQSIDIHTFPTAPGATQALLSRAVDAQIADAAVSKKIVDKVGTRVTISSREILYPVPVGLGVTQGNTTLKDALDQALSALDDRGRLDALLKQYNLRPIDPAMLNRALGSQ